MQERLVADWLTKAGERGGLDVALCQILLARGCKILRAGHSPTEAGKDIIAITPKRELQAYQVKSGNIDGTGGGDQQGGRIWQAQGLRRGDR